tara:strand:- start:397 stop:561 length:165 start_codon:yes stop_codon:yes gene_type:complete
MELFFRKVALILTLPIALVNYALGNFFLFITGFMIRYGHWYADELDRAFYGDTD